MVQTPDVDFGRWTKIVLRGMGQVIFQGHAGTGLCFLAGFLVASPALALGGLLGAIIGPAYATWRDYDQREIEQGIHGFNPTLVGIATIFYLDPTQFLT